MLFKKRFSKRTKLMFKAASNEDQTVTAAGKFVMWRSQTVFVTRPDRQVFNFKHTVNQGVGFLMHGQDGNNLLNMSVCI